MVGLTRRSWAVVFLIAGALPSLAVSDTVEESKWRYEKGRGLHYVSDGFQFLYHTRVQVLTRWQDLEPAEVASSGSFDLARFKLNMQGVIYDDWEFKLQAELTDSESSPRDLEDAFFVYRRKPLAKLWVGQGKIPFARQDMTSTESLQFVDRSLAAIEFRHNDAANDNRDVGIALIGQNLAKTYDYAVGIYNGNGINKDEDDNRDYMIVARFVVTPFGEYDLSETDLRRAAGLEREGRKSRLALGLSARKVVTGTEAIQEKQREDTFGLELAYQFDGLSVNGEFFTRSADETIALGTVERATDGWYLQAGWLFRNHLEVVGRYSEVLREPTIPPAVENLSEWGLALNYYFSGPGYKLQTDYRELEFEAADPTVAQQTPEIDRRVFRAQLQFRF